MLPTTFQFICPCSFRGEYSLEIGQSETKIACGSHMHVCQWIGIDTKFQFIGIRGFREKIKM
jgi:hypothetical protein